MKFIVRDAPPRAVWTLTQAGLHPLLAQLYAARGVTDPRDIDPGLHHLPAPDLLLGAQAAAQLLEQAIVDDRALCIVADYDCDGATACAVALRGLRLLGARRVQFLVPDRVQDGYGLTPAIAQRVKALGADVLITVDNGIASFEGVAAARALGLQVLVTDHHLPAQRDGAVQLPAADALVNPNQPGCAFPSKALAGVGVMFYVLLALRARLRAHHGWSPATQPRLDSLLPLVALGTVADVVRLDALNRRLVAQGLKRIRAGQACPGIQALFSVAGRDVRNASTFDLGFALGPRINAAGRLADMTLGIACLSTDDAEQALALAQQLDAINRERRELEGQMREQALARADTLLSDTAEPPAALCLSDTDFHEGVVGIVAARLKDRFHRPTFVFAPSGADGHADELKGSGRSIPGFHLRDALDLVAKRAPGVLLRFGGHAMAAGCTVRADQLPRFAQTLGEVAAELLDATTLQRKLETDGALSPEYCRADVVELLQREVWGQGFAAPLFSQELGVLSQRLVGERHLQLKLHYAGQTVDGIWFGRTDPLPERARLAFRLDVDTWRGQSQVRFVVEAVQA
ncbi:MAG: single-stranded-DNA-specific exonuclease RecJ [Rhodoferax sp.]